MSDGANENAWYVDWLIAVVQVLSSVSLMMLLFVERPREP